MTTKVPSSEEFQKSSDDFVKWFQSLPGATLHKDVKIQDLRHRNAGRGVVAKNDIPADTTLFSIPRSAILTVENSSLSRDFPHFFDATGDGLIRSSDGDDVDEVKNVVGEDDVDTSMHDVELAVDNDVDDSLKKRGEEEDDDDGMELDPWLKLIITLLYEYCKGEESQWHPYLSIFPQTFETPMFWSDTELDYLQSSPLRKRIGKETADEAFRSKILPLIKSHESSFFSQDGESKEVNGHEERVETPSDEELISQMHRMGSTIMAYAFDLEKDTEEDEDETNQEDGWIEDREGQTLGMVPFADMLNADAEFNAHLNHGEDLLTMVSIREIKAGEEVLNYYGPLPNSELLRRYGYTSLKHAVHDVAEVEWELFVTAIEKVFASLPDGQIKNILGKIDPDEIPESFVFESPTVEPDSTGLLPATSPEDVTGFTISEDLEAILSSTLRSISSSTSSSATNNALATKKSTLYKIALMGVEAKISSYATRIDEDEAMLKTVNVQSRRRMALEVVEGEKKVLRGTAQWLERKIRKAEEKEEEKERERAVVTAKNGKKRKR